MPLPPATHPHRPTAEDTNLDVLRAAAVLSVFVAHLAYVWDHSVGAWHLGQFGVLAFFVHTALVLMFSMERHSGSALVGSFYIRRLWRIYPLAIACVLVVFFTKADPELRGPTFTTWSARELFANVTLTTNLTFTREMIGSLWTLPIEVQMYVVLPVIFLFLRARSLPWAFAIWIITIPIAIAQTHVSGRLEMLSYAPCFMGGVLAWRLGRVVDQRLPAWLWPATIPLIALVWFGAPHDMLHTERTVQLELRFRWAFCALLGVAIPFFREIDPAAWLARMAHVVCRYSYGIYLTHGTIIKLCFVTYAAMSPVMRWSAFAVLSAGVPWVAYHAIEAPCITIGRRWASRLSAFVNRSRTRALEPAIGARAPGSLNP